ncbi:hypothetical protein Tco_0994101 [Tanacetum coccineum]
MLCYLIRMEPYYIQCIKDGPFQPKTAEGDDKPKAQWSNDEMRVINQDQRLKSIIISCLPDDIIYSVISNSDDEVDVRTSEEYLRDLDIEFHERALLAGSKWLNSSSVSSDFQPKVTLKLVQSSQQVQSSQNEPKIQKYYKTEYKKVKAKLALLEDEKEVSDDEELTQVNVLMSLVDDELAVRKNHARNGEWINITMRKVMDAPTIPISVDSSEGNFRDAIDIGLDVDHLVPVDADAFPAVTIVMILASLGEAIRGIHKYLKGVPIEEELSTLRFRMGMTEAENASLRSKIRTIEAIKTITRSQERRTRREMERQLALVQERYDQEGYTKGEVGDRVMLKVCLGKGSVRFGKRGKLNPRYVGPFQVLAKVGAITYKLELPQELSRVHNTFHVSNLKKCYVDEPLVVPLDGHHVDDKLHFVEEPLEIMD